MTFEDNFSLPRHVKYTNVFIYLVGWLVVFLFIYFTAGPLFPLLPLLLVLPPNFPSAPHPILFYFYAESRPFYQIWHGKLNAGVGSPIRG